MKVFRKTISLMLALAVVFSLSACSRRPASSGHWEGSDYTEESVAGNVASANSDTAKGNSSVTSSGKTKTKEKTQTNAKSQGEKASGNKGIARNNNTWKIMRDVKPSASKSVKGTNFGGKKFKMLVWQENYTTQDKANVAAFEKEYNCKITVDQINFEDYLTVMSTALSAGKPYDIIKTHNAFFPQAAISNLYQPMQKYVSSKDIISSSKKSGIDWNKTLLCATWSNNVYYLIDQRGSLLPVMIYNKLLFGDYGLEDAMSLYKKGKWTWEKIREYAKIVSSSNQGVYFFDDTVSGSYMVNGSVDFYSIKKDGTVKWNGANTNLYTNYAQSQKLRQLSPLAGEEALVENLVSGKAMLQVTEAEKLSAFVNSFKGSAALGKNLNNVGVVPIPLNAKEYKQGSVIGYAANRGADPSAAVAFTLFVSGKSASWASSGIQSLEKNTAVFEGLYKKMSYSGIYTFLSASGQRINEAIYPMYGEIENGGDIMKLLENYSAKVKAILEYNFSQQ